MEPVTVSFAPFFRAAKLEGAPDKETRCVPLSFSSETPVLRILPKDFPHKELAGKRVHEVLDHGEGCADFSVLRSLCVDHDLTKQVGRIEGPRLDGKRGVGVARFSRKPAAEDEYQDVLEGIRSDVSMGYHIHRAVIEPAGADGIPTLRATRWQPLLWEGGKVFAAFIGPLIMQSL